MMRRYLMGLCGFIGLVVSVARAQTAATLNAIV